jgi:hydroxymethylglutaryl-CoA lyase
VTTLRDAIVLHEVGLRDGLQMEKQLVPFEQKVRWAEALLQSGIDILQLGSFVHPEKVPQMADTDRLFSYFSHPGRKPAKVILSGLVLNEKGLDRGFACGVDMFCMGVSASETHSRKNTGMSTDEALSRIIPMARDAIDRGKKVQVSVQSAFGCGFEGLVPLDRVLSIVRKYQEAGLRNISLADTAGHAHPSQVKQMLNEVLRPDPELECTCHFHNTYGLGIANCFAAMEWGVRILETSCAGLGGCSFTRVAAGNVCTEDLVHTLHRMGTRTDIDLKGLLAVAKDLSAFFGREMPGLVYKTGPVATSLQS